MSEHIDLIDTITREPHEDWCDFSWYQDFIREAPDGNPCKINVEVLAVWDGPDLNVRYYGYVRELTPVMDGLAILPDTVFLFSKEELELLDICRQMEDERQEQFELKMEAKFA